MYTRKFVPLMLATLLILGFFTVVIKPVSADLIENSWNTKTPMSQARHSLGVVAVDGKIYAIGGYTCFGYALSKDNIVGTNERYDPKTDTWTTMASMPTPRGSFAIVAYEDKIYCIGGTVNTIPNADLLISRMAVSCNIVEIYDTVIDSWSTKATPLPVDLDGINIDKLTGVRACVTDGKIFLFFTNFVDNKTLYVYPEFPFFRHMTNFKRPK